ncbi:unnamed protein product, partial [Rotaria magnacalcarata]
SADHNSITVIVLNHQRRF